MAAKGSGASARKFRRAANSEGAREMLRRLTADATHLYETVLTIRDDVLRFLAHNVKPNAAGAPRFVTASAPCFRLTATRDVR